jgi:hypothetical protein
LEYDLSSNTMQPDLLVLHVRPQCEKFQKYLNFIFILQKYITFEKNHKNIPYPQLEWVARV